MEGKVVVGAFYCRGCRRWQAEEGRKERKQGGKWRGGRRGKIVGNVAGVEVWARGGVEWGEVLGAFKHVARR